MNLTVIGHEIVNDKRSNIKKNTVSLQLLHPSGCWISVFVPENTYCRQQAYLMEKFFFTKLVYCVA